MGLRTDSPWRDIVIGCVPEFEFMKQNDRWFIETQYCEGDPIEPLIAKFTKGLERYKAKMETVVWSSMKLEFCDRYRLVAVFEPKRYWDMVDE